MTNAMTTAEPARTDYLSRWTWGLVVAALLVYWTVAFFFWHLVDWLTPFLAPVIFLPVYGLAAFALAFALLVPFRRWKTRRWAGLLPLGLFVLGFAAASLVDFTWLWLRTNFSVGRQGRDEVARRIIAGELRPNVSYNATLIHLPDSLRHLSLGGGDVVIDGAGERTKILFFTFRGILHHFAGFVYSPDDSAPQDGDFLSDFIIIRRMDKNWYYVSSK